MRNLHPAQVQMNLRSLAPTLPNRLRTGTGPRPRDWGSLIHKILLLHI